MSAQSTRMLGLVAALLIITGATLGLVPVRADGQPCGRAFHSTGFTAACADAVTSRRAPVVAMLVAGVAAAVVAAGAGQMRRTAQDVTRRASARDPHA